MSWLVTGGAGYIGAHVARCLLESGREVVVLDDFSSGRRPFVPSGATLVEGTITDPGAVDRALAAGTGRVDGVVHLAGYKYAGVSVQRPLHTYWQNVTGMQVLLERMLEHDVLRFVFSSSAATFGDVDVPVVTEATPTDPASPYGETKLIGEWLLRDVARTVGLRHTSLRYFNVVGSGHDDVYDVSPHNLMPRVLKAVGEGEAPQVFGTDYDTPDGSCVRDYVHVQDVALAHVAAAEAMEEGRDLEPVYNLGSGTGLSVLEIMAAVRRVTGNDVAPVVHPRRPGDPARIVAAGELAAKDLGWEQRYSVDDMVESAWKAWTTSLAAT